MSGIVVKFSREDFDAAWANGEARHRHHCERKGRAPKIRGLAEEGCGVVGEAAVARLMGGTFNAEIGRAHYGSDDVITICGDPIEVKATEWKSGRLLIYTKTPDTLPVVLVIVNRESHEARVVGWIAAADGKRAAWWEASFHTPCWAVPQHALRPLEELPCIRSLLSSSSRLDSPPPTGASETPPSES